ncbi:MAG: formylglycine-generating enzyme family protein [bacterium]|nr:formylglycine-generating enzyme family protein [bacterium]
MMDTKIVCLGEGVTLPLVELPSVEVFADRRVFMGKYAVTEEQWKSVVKDRRVFFNQDANFPIIYITHDNALAFCKKLSDKTGLKFYLPSEMEWAVASLFGKEECKGIRDSKLSREYAWFRENSRQKVHPVGKLKPNNWGLYDMFGNIWEWCSKPVSKGGSCQCYSVHIMTSNVPGTIGFDRNTGLRVLMEE